MARALETAGSAAAPPVATAQGAGYMPQLDSLRAVAVLAVMFHHYYAAVPPETHWPHVDGIPFGLLGVKLFFVLSGFLITGILLRARRHAESTGLSRFAAMGGFYARRSLRIFPLYYGVIAVCLVLNVPPVRDEIVWLLTYTLNLRISYQGWYPANIAHFWSLAVEEQFYLLWPWVVLFAPRGRLWLMALAFAALGPAFRTLAMLMEFSGEAYSTFTLSSFDALGAGALLAIASGGAPVSARLRRFLAGRLLPGGLLLVGLLVASHGAASRLLWAALFDTAIAMVYVSVIGIASAGMGGFIGRLLEASVLTYLGKISYGMYVYHALLQDWILRQGASMGVPWRTDSFFVVAATTTIAVAALSWHFFERPINELKRRFPQA